MSWNRFLLNLVVEEPSAPDLFQSVHVLDDHEIYLGVKKIALQWPNDRVRNQIAWEMYCCADVCAEGERETCRALE